MLRVVAHRPSPAMLVAMLALFISLGGSAYAAFSLPKNSVGTKQLKNGSVTTRKIKNGAVTRAKLNLNGGTGRMASATTSAPRVCTRSCLLSSWPMLSAIDHIGVAVEDLDAALALYQNSLQLPLVHRETVTQQGVEAALLDVGESHVELLAPLDPDTPVGKFLARRGPGLHHVAYRVDDIEQTLSELAAEGMELIDEQPRVGIRGAQVAFVKPASTGGVLTEIVQPAPEVH